MARKENKLRPYRVDYFDIAEMKVDKILLRAQVVRAVTAQQAANMVLYNDPTASGNGEYVEGRIIIRSYRFYKKLNAKETYKAVEDMFSTKKSIQIMEIVEKWRLATAKTEYHVTETPATLPPHCGETLKVVPEKFDRSSSTVPFEAIQNSTLPQEQKDRLTNLDPLGHQTRFSDSSLYDEVCNLCGATDRGDALNKPCPQANQPTVQKAVTDVYAAKVPDDVLIPPSGPESPATQAVMADYTGMFTGDRHEELMKKIDLDTAAPIIHPAPTAVEEASYQEMLARSTQTAEPPISNDGFWFKLLAFGAVTTLAIIIVIAILNCH